MQKQLEEQNIRFREEIGERMQIEETLKAILDTSPVGIAKAENRIFKWGNANIHRMLGYEPDELLGQDLKIIYPGTDEYQRVGKELYAQIEKTGKGSIETLWMRKDGTVFDCYVRSCALDLSDPAKGQIVVATDITDRKDLEKELKAAKKAAESASRIKSIFLANMSHEFRTPLHIISGYAQILQQTREYSPIIREYADIIFQSGNHLLTLINDILDISKIATNELKLTPCEMDFTHFLKQLEEISRIQAKEKSLEFRYEPDPDLPLIIEADEKRLRQVLLSLLGNALRFTDNGVIIFRVTSCKSEVTADSRPAACICFEITDTGQGMTQEQIEKIFLPFEQLRDAENWHEGTGSGLTVTTHLISLMGGKTEVESEPGRGSTFRFNIAVPAIRRTISNHISDTEDSTHKVKLTKTEFEVPPPKELEKLYQLAILGFMDSIREYADHIGRTDTRYAPFAAELKKLAGNFEDEKLLAFIEEIRDA
ncbi:ATP-binding protein [Desulfococcaceae bacterium HSG8]|nr:ATP-binding protein [Desulfococcaceae bacterium HSG8]